MSLSRHIYMDATKSFHGCDIEPFFAAGLPSANMGRTAKHRSPATLSLICSLICVKTAPQGPQESLVPEGRREFRLLSVFGL